MPNDFVGGPPAERPPEPLVEEARAFQDDPTLRRGEVLLRLVREALSLVPNAEAEHDVATSRDVSDAKLAEVLGEMRDFTPTACHWALNVAAHRLRAGVAERRDPQPSDGVRMARMHLDGVIERIESYDRHDAIELPEAAVVEIHEALLLARQALRGERRDPPEPVEQLNAALDRLGAIIGGINTMDPSKRRIAGMDIEALRRAIDLRGAGPQPDGWAEAQTGHNETVAMCEAAVNTALQTWANTTKDERTVDDVVRDALAACYVPSRGALRAGGPAPDKEQISRAYNALWDSLSRIQFVVSEEAWRNICRDLSAYNLVARALSGGGPPEEEKAKHLALRNVLGLATRIKRHGLSEGDADHLIRFCAEAGVKPSILREASDG